MKNDTVLLVVGALVLLMGIATLIIPGQLSFISAQVHAILKIIVGAVAIYFAMQKK